MDSDYPPRLEAQEESELLEVASDYSLSHGLVLRPVPSSPSSPLSTTTSIHAPYSLYPTPFPSHLFKQAIDLQPAYNALYANITTNDEFLKQVVGGNVQKVDEFQRKLYEIWTTVKREGIKQPITLGIFRSDYLIHAPEGIDDLKDWTLKQVEFNTISSSFGALSTRVSELHRYLLESHHYPQNPLHPYLSDPSRLPENHALDGIAKGLVDAHKAYENHENASIMMVIQDGERNAFDQRLLEWKVTRDHKIPLLRIPFSQLRTTLSLSPTNSSLLYTPPNSSKPIEISLIYYRTAYSPTDYYTPQEWSTRLLIERSLAIKCPSVGMQLAGCKKVQQVLFEPRQLSKFMNQEEEQEKLRSSFVGLWGMEEGGEGERLVKERPERFVLKPQREGGGNNIYRNDIPPFLRQLEEEDQQSRGGEDGGPKGQEGYILMELIEPPLGQTQLLVKAGEDKARRADVVSELGIYGVVLLKENLNGEGVGGCEVLRNETVGHLLRTKGRESDEGGIAVGFSVLDSPVLI
ncbi:hypothetical protein JCM16303_004842 [Sporobolomyces ruberrimus]